MAEIDVHGEGGAAYSVSVSGRHFAVTAAQTLSAELGAPDAAALIRASFGFLLQREPVGSILPRFDLSVIERYFPEWPEVMRQRFR
jgi:hypothetical protein